MQLVAEDILCPSCAGYVHPFLDGCPACGTRRTSRYGMVAAGLGATIGAAALVVDDATRRAAHFVVLRYSLRSGSVAAMPDLAEGFGVVAGSLTYRAAAAAEGPMPALPLGQGDADNVSLGLIEGAIAIRAVPSARTFAEIPLESVLAATPIAKRVPPAAAWAGASLGSRHVAERRLLADADLLVTFAGAGTWGQLAVANRRGMFAPHARSDHFTILSRWIGILAAAAAEARWQAAGPAAYAAELCLGDRPDERADGGGHAGGLGADAGQGARAPGPGGEGVGSGPIGVRGALEQLEELRRAGLISDAEYVAKRSEILSRL
jgi:hypothetical protein